MYFIVLLAENRGRGNGSNNCSGGRSEHNSTNAEEWDDGSDEERRRLLAVNGQRGNVDLRIVE